jgi:hypothetical protein
LWRKIIDRNIANYRPKLCNNKWWWQVFIHLLSASVSNAWILYRIRKDENKRQANDDEFLHNSHPLDLPGFIRNIVATYLLLNVRQPNHRTTSTLFRKIPESVSGNTSVLHYPDTSKQNRCKTCKKNTTFACGVCKINVHPVDCFKYFHQSTLT